MPHEPRDARSQAFSDISQSISVARDLFVSKMRSRHRRLMLSYLWLFLPSLAFMGVFVAIRSHEVLLVGEVGIPYGVYVLSGMILWQGVNEAMSMPIAQLGAHRQFLFRAAVPHEVVLLAGLGEVLFNSAIRLVLLLVVALIAGIPVAASWALVPVASLSLTLLGLGVGLCLAPYGLLFDDIARGLGLLSSVLLLATPIVYTLPPGSPLRFNPLVPAIEAGRAWLAGGSAPMPGALLIQILVAFALVVIGWAQYRAARPHLAARLG